MKLIRFVLKKILIVEVMLLVLYFAKTFFNLDINFVNLIVDNGLKYLTPIAVPSLILYFLTYLLNSKIIKIAIGIALGGIILYYLIRICNGEFI